VEKFSVHTGRVLPLRRSDVDTDQIIPAVWLKQVSRTGFGAGLFAAWRANDPAFVLNRPEYEGASILVAGPDFGTGSSREHAVWALQDYGFRVVLSPRFGDIFRGNSLKAGLLTVVVPEDVVEQLWERTERDPAAERPRTEDQVCVPHRVVRMEMRHEGDLQSRRLECRNAPAGRGRTRPPHHTGPEVDQIGGVVHHDRRGWTRSIRRCRRSPRAQEDDSRCGGL